MTMTKTLQSLCSHVMIQQMDAERRNSTKQLFTISLLDNRKHPHCIQIFAEHILTRRNHDAPESMDNHNVPV